MERIEFEELAGRIEGLAQALLRLTAALEASGAVHGPTLEAGWQLAVAEPPDTRTRQVARQTLLRLAGATRDARRWRGAASP